MLNAFLLGAIAQVTLLLSGLIPFRWTIPVRYIGWLAGFGAGALIAAIADDLAPQALTLGDWEFALWVLLGAVIFLGLDRVVEKRFGGGGQSGALGIVLGALVDGVPESLIFGIQIATGMAMSWAFLFAVMVSNIPQALAPSAELAQAKWSRLRVAGMWGAVVVLCGVAAAIGYFVAYDVDNSLTGARAAAIAAGGLLAMLTNSLIPFAYERGGDWTGMFMVIGFVISYGMP